MASPLFTDFILLAASLLVVTSRAAPQSTKLAITMPEECKEKGFCAIRPHDYDEIENKINALLPPYIIGMNSRSGGPIEQHTEDDDNCPSVITSESVYAYEHPTGTAVDIIVQTKLFPQTITKVKCKYNYRGSRDLGDDQQCFRNLGISDLNLKSRCHESTATRTLLVYDPDVDSLKIKNYTIPVCCSCRIWKS